MTGTEPPPAEVWRRDEIESPCIKLCVIHPEARLCMGCYRSIGEISDWTRMSAEMRAAVIAELPARSARVRPARKGGRSARRPPSN